MALFDQIRRIGDGSRRTTQRRRRRIPGRVDRLVLEALEDRLAPTASTWSGAVSGLWSDPGTLNTPSAPSHDLVFPAGEVTPLDSLVGTTTSVTSSTSSAVFGQPVTLTATVASNDASNPNTPTGNVQFFSGTTLLGTGALVGDTATVPNVTTLTAGADSVTAKYVGDDNFAASTSTPVTINVAQATTSTTVTATPNPVGLGQPLSLSATVTAASPSTATPDGTVQFFSGTTSLGTATLSGGTAMLSTTSLTAGANTITAQYQGNGNLISSTSAPLTVNANPASTTKLTASSSSIVHGQTVTLTATVAAADSSSTNSPTGSVKFLSGTNLLGTATISGGSAILLNVSPPTGTDSVTAQYTGDSNFGVSTSTPVTINVAQASTSTAVTVTPSPSVVGQTVSLSATVSAVSPGAGTPTGTVQFLSGTTSLGSGTLSSGVATLSTSALTAGVNAITARYSGDTDFTASTSPAFSQTVNQPTTTTVASSPSPSVTGQPVMLTANVVAPTGTPDGTVQFFSGTTSLGTATLSGGVAMLTTTALTAGANSITAQYQGSGNFPASTSVAITQTVNQAGTSTTVTATPNPTGLGQPVSLSATVAPVSPGSGTPTGTVQFFSGTTSLGTATLSGGTATLSTTALTAGSNSITAQYQGDANFSTSTSAAVSETIIQGNSTVTLTATKTNPVSAEAVTFTATVAALSPATGTPTGTVNFYSNGTFIGSGTLSGGQATFTTTDLAVGSQSITAVYEGDNTFTVGTSTPLAMVVGDSNELFLNQVYLDVFHLPIDQPGLNDWRTLLETGTPRSQVVRMIIHSPQSRQTKMSLERRILGTQPPRHQTKPQLVNSLYLAILGRPADPRGLKTSLAVLNQSGVNHLILGLLSSDEFFVNATKKA